MRLAARSTLIAGVLAIAAIAAPAASARPNLEPGLTAHSQAAGPRPEVHGNLAHRTSSASIPATTRLTAHGSPFAWGDAAIGAASGMGLSLLILGGTLMVSRRRNTNRAAARALTS